MDLSPLEVIIQQ